MTTDLRSEANQLLDVLVDRLAAVRQTLAGDPVEHAEGAGEHTEGAGEHSEGAGDRPEDPAARTAIGDPAPICPTCGHDSREVSCSGCPLCALLAMLRGERPELTARLVDGALQSLQAIRGLLGGPAGATEPTVPDDDGTSGEPPAPERIDIR